MRPTTLMHGGFHSVRHDHHANANSHLAEGDLNR
jgi:hypothetical protein